MSVAGPACWELITAVTSKGSFGIRSAELRGDHDFFDEFTDDLTFFEVGDFTFSLEPLATHG